MNQPAREPEYSVVESQETLHMVNGQLHSDIDYNQVAVDLEDLYVQAKQLVNMCLDIANSTRVLALSLREQE